MDRRLCIKTLLSVQAALMGSTSQPVLSREATEFEQLDIALERLIRKYQIPGMAIGIVSHGALVHARGFGVTRLGGAVPVTPRTLFHTASITKTLVAAAIIQLKERGAIDLDSPVLQYLPYFRLADPRAADITVMQMLTHTSGMPDVKDYGWSHPEFDDRALERYVRSLTDQRLLAAPGSHFAYSNMAFEILGDVIAKMSGATFEDYSTENILMPIGMRSSTLFFPGARDKRLLAGSAAAGHIRDARGRAVAARDYPYNRAHSPSSNLVSNVSDLAQWAMVNMAGGAVSGGRIFSAAAGRDMWTARADAGHGAKVGITWFLSDFEGLQTVGHSGSDTGFHSNLVMIPSRGLAAIYLTNCDYDSREEATGILLDAALSHYLRNRGEPSPSRGDDARG